MRDQEISEKFKKEVEGRRTQIYHSMFELYKKNCEIYKKEFINALTEALKKFISRQNAENIVMKYIHVNCLRVSLETETYEYVIRVMDESEYADRRMVEVDYVPSYLKEFIDEDRAYFTRLIMSNVIRAKKYEVKNFLRKYIWDTYIKPIPTEIHDVLSEIEELEIYSNVLKSEKIVVGYGEVLETLDERWIYTS